jgi:hypothetical protein
MTIRRDPFFNRQRAIDALQVLALAGGMMGTTFAGLDLMQSNQLGAVSGGFFAICALSVVATFLLSRSLRASLRPAVSGASLGLLFLGTIWVLSRGLA